MLEVTGQTPASRTTFVDLLADAVLEAFILRKRERFVLLQRLREALAARERAA